MQITVITVGKRTSPWLKDALTEYAARFPREFRPAVIEIAPARRGKTEPAEKVIAAEARRIRAATPDGHRVIALDEGGRQLDTRALAARLRSWTDNDENIAFLVGGADGLDPGLLRDADECWSLTALTLPHGLARLVLMEQLYRAWSILNNHPYHRE